MLKTERVEQSFCKRSSTPLSPRFWRGFVRERAYVGIHSRLGAVVLVATQDPASPPGAQLLSSGALLTQSARAFQRAPSSLVYIEQQQAAYLRAVLDWEHDRRDHPVAVIKGMRDLDQAQFEHLLDQLAIPEGTAGLWAAD